MVKWKDLDPQPIIDHCLSDFKRYGVYPSVRDIFYAFVGELWPNTKSAYKGLSKWLRDQRLSGKIDWKMVRDGAGREFEHNDFSFFSTRNYVDSMFSLFTEIASNYKLPRWLGQPKKVVVVCEKEADYPITKALVGFNRLNVDTAYARGYSGWLMLHDIAEKFKEHGGQPVIIALSDFDPSGGDGAKRTGKDLVSFLLKAMLKLGVSDVQVEKILVMKDQVERFNLPHRPEDAKEIAKLQRDSRFKTWPWGLYRVETAALRKKQPEFFDRCLKDAVMKHFDEHVWKQVEKKQEELQGDVDLFFSANDSLIEELRTAIEQSEDLEGLEEESEP